MTTESGWVDQDTSDPYLSLRLAPPRDRPPVNGQGMAAEAPSWAHRLLDGAKWLQSGSPTIDALWGLEDDVPAPRHQPTIFAGTSGAGKTTLIQRIALGALGAPGFEELLGWPVMPTDGRVLYLAADRPDQARLSMLRMVTSPRAWELVEKRLAVLPGPPPEDLAANPLLLLEMARYAEATLIVPDSLKDMAMKLSDDAVGAKVNMAFQHVIADGRDLVCPHHVRKVGRQDTGGVTIDDLYGSAWLFNGAGSVVYLEPGPVDVELRQLKTPNGRMASARFVLAPSGECVTGAGDPVLVLVRDAGEEGITPTWLASCAYHKEKPSEADVARVRRRLSALEGLGMVVQTGTGRTNRWVAV